MPVEFVKAKVKDVEKLDSSVIVTPEVVDEYATKKAKLAKKLDKLAPLTKEVAKLEKGIIGAVDEVVDAAEKIDLQGFEFELKLGAQGKSVVLTDPEKAQDFLGDELFMKLAKITVADLKAYLTPDQMAEVTNTIFKIKRRVKIEAL